MDHKNITMQNNTEEARRQTEKRDSQFASFSLQSDKKKLEREHSGLQAEIRQIQVEIGHLKASLENKEIALRSSEGKIEMVDEQITREKKHMNSLS